MDIVQIEIRQDMIKMMEILKNENSYVKSEIEGLNDLLWSMGARTICPGGESLIKWFHSPVPAFNNRVPMDILKEDGEIELYKWMSTIPC